MKLKKVITTSSFILLTLIGCKREDDVYNKGPKGPITSDSSTVALGTRTRSTDEQASQLASSYEMAFFLDNYIRYQLVFSRRLNLKEWNHLAAQKAVWKMETPQARSIFKLTEKDVKDLKKFRRYMDLSMVKIMSYLGKSHIDDELVAIMQKVFVDYEEDMLEGYLHFSGKKLNGRRLGAPWAIWNWNRKQWYNCAKSFCTLLAGSAAYAAEAIMGDDDDNTTIGAAEVVYGIFFAGVVVKLGFDQFKDRDDLAQAPHVPAANQQGGQVIVGNQHQQHNELQMLEEIERIDRVR